MVESAVPQRVQAAAPAPADNVVALVSQTVVNQGAFMNNCGIPLAAFVDFHPPAQVNLPRISHRQPARCKACASFMNVYCKADRAKNVWKCNLCGQANVHKDDAAQDLPELREEAVEYVYPLPTSPTGAPAGPGTEAPPNSLVDAKPPGHVVLVIDSTLTQEAMQNLRSAAVEALAALDPSTLLSVISCDSVVSLHNLSPPPDYGSNYFSHALPGGDVVNTRIMSYYLQQSDIQMVVPLGECLPYLGRVLSSIRPMETEKPVRQRSRCLFVAVEAALHLAAAYNGIEASATSQKLPMPSRLLLMVSGPITKGPGRVDLELLDDLQHYSKLKNKPAMKSARQHASELAEIAKSIGMPIDVFVGGELAVNIPVLGLLSHDSGGELVAHECFGPLFGANLTAALTREFGVRGVLDCFVSDGVRLVQWMGSVDVLQPWPNDHYNKLISDRRLSANACCVSNLQLGHGAAIRLELTQDLEVPVIYLQVVLQFLEVSTWAMVQRVTTRRLHVVKTIGEYLPGVQPAVASVVSGKKMVLDAKKLGAMSESEKAEEVRYSASAQISQVARRFGREVQVSHGVFGFGAKKAWALPIELLPLAAAIYNFQRGPCVGGWHMHPDERLLHMNTLLSAGGTAASLAMSPQLYLVEVDASYAPQAPNGGSAAAGQPHAVRLHPVPTVNVAAHMYASQGKMLLLDTGASFMLLTPPSVGQHGTMKPSSTVTDAGAFADSGATASSSASGGDLDPQVQSALTAQCRALAAGRFPVPELRIMSADVEAYRMYFMQSLVPVHRDSIEDQQIQFPGLRNLSGQEIRKLLEPLLMPTDEEGFVAWCRNAEVLPFHALPQ